MSHSPSAPSRLPLALAALVCLLIAACGEPVVDENTQGFERIDFAPAEGSSPIEPIRAVRAYDFMSVDDVLTWDVEAPDKIMSRLPGTDPKSTKALRLRAMMRTGPVELSKTGEFDTSTFDTVRVTNCFQGTGTMVAELYRGGELVHTSPPAYLLVSDTPVALDLRLNAPADLPVCDELVLAMRDITNRVMHVVSIELMSVPPGSALPPAEDAPVAHALGDESRLAERVVTARPLVARLTPGNDAELRFTYGRDRICTTPDDAVLVATAADAISGDVLVDARFAAPAEIGTWTRATVDLDAAAGRDIVLSLALEGPEQAWLVGEAALWGPKRLDRPHVVIVTSDTHRADHVAAQDGSVDVRTPHLDALAAEGVLFLDCISPSNVTNPSHISLFTGKHPRDTGVLLNQLQLAERAYTLAEVFADAGYVTYGIGAATHIGHIGSGLGQGFDRYSWPASKWADAEDLVDLAEELLDESDGHPTFVWLHVFDAHWPYAPPGRFDRAYYPDDVDPEDPSFPDEPVRPEKLPRDLEYARAQYKGEVSYLDRELGRLLDLDELEDAIVAVTADHGEGLGESDVYFDHVELYPGSIRIPLLMRWPDGPRGRKAAHPITHVDVGYTLARLAGLSPDFPGRDLSAVIEHPVAPRPRYMLSFGGHSASLMDEDDYCILHLTDHKSPNSTRGFESHQVELYDLAADPTCQVDLVDAEPDTARDMRGRLITWLEAADTDGLVGEVNVEAEFLQQLRDLGYTDEDQTSQDLWKPDDCDWCKRLRR